MPAPPLAPITPAPPTEPQWESTADLKAATATASPIEPKWESTADLGGGAASKSSSDRFALSSGTIKPEDTMNPGANKWLKENHPKVYSALEGFLTLPERGSEQLARAIKPGRTKAERTADAIEGGLTLGSPLLMTVPGSGHVTSVATGLGAAAVAQPVVSSLAKTAGAAEDTQRAAGDVAFLVAGGIGAKAGGKVASWVGRGMPTANPFALSRAITGRKAWSPKRANFDSIIDEAAHDISTYGKAEPTSNAETIEYGRQARDYLQDKALQPYLDAATAKNVQAPMDSMIDAVEKAIPSTQRFEEDAIARRNGTIPAYRQTLLDAETIYRGVQKPVEEVRQWLKEANQAVDALKDRTPGKQRAVESSGSDLAIQEAKRDELARILYKTLDDASGGKGPHDIQRRTGNIMQVVGRAEDPEILNKIAAEKPNRPIYGLGKLVSGAVDVAGSPVKGSLEAASGKLAHPFKGPTDAQIEQIFKGTRGKAKPLPKPASAQPVVPPITAAPPTPIAPPAPATPNPNLTPATGGARPPAAPPIAAATPTPAPLPVAAPKTPSPLDANALMRLAALETDPVKAGQLRAAAAKLGPEAARAVRQSELEQAFSPGQRDYAAEYEKVFSEERRRDAANVEAQASFKKPYDELGIAQRKLVDRTVLDNYIKSQSNNPPRPAGEMAANPPEPVAVAAPSESTSGPIPSAEAKPDVEVTPEVAGETQPYPVGNTAKALTPRGTNVDVQYAVVDAADPIVSHDLAGNENPKFPSERQPRDRTRLASQSQIEGIASGLDYRRVAGDYRATDGAPITDENLVVEAGNGRANGIRLAYQKYPERAAAYKQDLINDAPNLGLNPKDFSGIKQPMLVRVRRSQIDPAQFAAEANEPWTAAMSASEQALSDAQRMSPQTLGMFVPSESGDIVHAGNQDFIRAFMDQVVSPAERARYQTADGSISQEGVARIRNAIFARAYGETSALEKLAEATDSNIKNITNGMLSAAPRFVDIQRGIEAGTLHPTLDIAPDVSAAVGKLSALRERGTTVADYLNQIAMFDDGVSPEARNILGVFDKYGRAPRKIGRILESYADGVEAAGDPNQQGLFGTIKAPTKGEILEAAVKETEKEFADEQASKRAKAAPVENVPGEPSGGSPAPSGSNGVAKANAANEQAKLKPPNLQRAGEPPATADLFGPEVSQAQRSAEALAKEKLSGDQLAAEFNSPITAANRRTKLKPGAKPVQESMFEKATEPPPQTGFDFQREAKQKGLKQTFDQPWDSTDRDGSIERSAYRIYPETPKMPARMYVDDTGAALFSAVIHAVSGAPQVALEGVQLGGEHVTAIASMLRKAKASPGAKAKLGEIADSLDKTLADNPKGVIVVRGTTGKPIANLKGTAYHEAAHQAQQALSGQRSRPFFHYDTQVQDIPNYNTAAMKLRQMGYDAADKEEMVKEILSIAAEGNYNKAANHGMVNRLGFTKPEMVDTVASIVDKTIAVHGDAGYALIEHASPSFKAAVREKLSERSIPAAAGSH